MIKIKDSKETVNGGKTLTLRFTKKDLKPKIRDIVCEEGMYGFEKVFGESDGHGCGPEGEDINFTIPKEKTGCKHPLAFWMTDSGKEIKVIERLNLYSHKYPNEYYESRMINISSELVKFLKKTILAR